MHKYIVMISFFFVGVGGGLSKAVKPPTQSDYREIVSAELKSNYSFNNFLARIKERKSSIIELVIDSVPYVFQVKLISSSAEDPFFLGFEKYPPLHFKSISSNVPAQFKNFSLKPTYNQEYRDTNSNKLSARVADLVLRKYKVSHLKYFWVNFKWSDGFLGLALAKTYNVEKTDLTKSNINYYSPDEKIDNLKLNLNKVETFVDLTKSTKNLAPIILLADTDSLFSISNFYTAKTIGGDQDLVLTDLDWAFSACELVGEDVGEKRKKSGHYFRSILDGEFKNLFNSSEVLKNIFRTKNETLQFEDLVGREVDNEIKLVQNLCSNYQGLALCSEKKIAKYKSEINKAASCSRILLDKFVISLIDNNF